ncbi:hypothetical protein ZWY2020_058921 [Hordeum vulgare]|nr:hypothetical protein ZWY2020_011080 [Hordeum vulgare]KAI5022191.1 hypothetical protein ZWY2020_058921 [Hordeum vulgare]
MAASTIASKALTVLAFLSVAAFSVVSAQDAPAPSPVSTAGVAAPSLAAALVASGAAFVFAAICDCLSHDNGGFISFSDCTRVLVDTASTIYPV